MKKIVYKFLITTIVLVFISTIYLSTIGVKTDKFNLKISDKIREIDENFNIKLKKVNIILNPLEFNISANTLDADLIYRDKVIKLKSIKSKISLKALMEGKSSLSTINISTKTINIENLYTFIRLIKNDPKIYIAQKFIKKGNLTANIEIEFDDQGNIKKNYKVAGSVKDGKINILKKYDLDNINFNFNFYEKNYKFFDLKLSLNNKKIFVPQIIAKKKDNIYFVSGKINTQNIILDDKYIKDFIKQDTLNIDIKEIDFDSENDFDLKIQKNFKIKDLNIVSKINLDYLIIENPLELEKIFPNINKKISFKNHKIKINYKKDYLKITGSGETILQNEIDTLEYKILKNKDEIKYDTSLIISKNLFNIDFLNYEKNKETDLKLNIKAKKISNKDLIFEEVTLKEKNNTIFVKNLILTNNNKINEIEKIQVDYIDKENLENKIKLMKINDNYLINGNSFNINKIISVLLEADNSKNKKLFNKNLKFDFDLKKVYLDEKNIIRDFQGYLFLNDNKVSELSLEAKFENQKNIKLTINSNNGDQITTLFSNEAKPLVDRYKFIKGFNEGSLDFYSIKKNNNTKSTLKIYDFKLKELPALTKILTLASLQGIADLLSGEGIRFSEFEMNFSNKDNLMTIDEIYAIGPAISILMDGYIEKKKLISLRGTLVPATTINKTIGSIPILGDILVGKKTGEGVFGVSFKVKGPPKNLETSVNPIKTLTPRFITRTLEKLKKTN